MSAEDSDAEGRHSGVTEGCREGTCGSPVLLSLVPPSLGRCPVILTRAEEVCARVGTGGSRCSPRHWSTLGEYSELLIPSTDDFSKATLCQILQ